MPNLEGYKEKYKDERFFNDIFIDGEYRACLDGVDRNDLVVLDIGGLAGEFSFWIYDYAKEIYCVEPTPKYYEELVNNIETFGFTKVKPFNLAIGGEDGQGFIDVVKTRGAEALTHTPTDCPVKVMTLASFIKENKINHIDILKIDIEGGEKAVFTASDFPEVVGIIDVIIGEHIDGEILKEFGFIEKPSRKPNAVYRRNNG